MEDEPETKIDRTIPTHDFGRCLWCETSHPPWFPHRRSPPGERIDPTLRFRNRADRPVVGRRFRLNTAEMVAPENRHYLGFKEVEALAWMCREACSDEFRAPYGTTTIFDTLQNHSTCINGTDPPRLYGGRDQWREKLGRHLHAAILCQRLPIHSVRWKTALGLVYDNNIWVPGPSIRPWSQKKADEQQPSTGQMDATLTAVLTMSGAMAWSLNCSHPEAVYIHGVYLHLGSKAWFSANYSYQDDASSWHETLAVQEKGEPLLFTTYRAGAYLGRLMDSEAEPPIVQAWASHGGKRAMPAPWVMDGIIRDGRASRLPKREVARA